MEKRFCVIMRKKGWFGREKWSWAIFWSKEEDAVDKAKRIAEYFGGEIEYIGIEWHRM